ncbi:hypothetical protein [Leptolyngbya sp. KIOST-1]|uniref:hypothetical protein n=1 Tax=Leptolyngbya sp. KIOST-1 TaxID=1229172 RepID=UPI000565AA1B|nr:hypothetical protein [Leptolyngbya sp. KIOST-1]
MRIIEQTPERFDMRLGEHWGGLGMAAVITLFLLLMGLFAVTEERDRLVCKATAERVSCTLQTASLNAPPRDTAFIPHLTGAELRSRTYSDGETSYRVELVAASGERHNFGAPGDRDRADSHIQAINRYLTTSNVSFEVRDTAGFKGWIGPAIGAAVLLFSLGVCLSYMTLSRCTVDRRSKKLTVYHRNWLGQRRQTSYSFSQIKQVKVVKSEDTEGRLVDTTRAKLHNGRSIRLLYGEPLKKQQAVVTAINQVLGR